MWGGRTAPECGNGGKTMNRLEELFRSNFVKGLLCGAILVGLLFVSWRFMLLAGGIAALYFLFFGKKC